ncbi:Eukaryotic translation initiation factor 4E-binding protein 1 [Nibea albiflora]|uniref:Eukaryotic translation initiation factor 4E-binding protein 1 n=1 Tax=Nibea albiflora TaxID=240163 RepID=A0ACB7FCK4_NIBAL|nr:Eukaryotic translation initiation factor 4E-binding protein 1 [Nibea albiflora]
MSTDCQKTTAKAIPSTRRVTISDSAHMPHDYSTTPGGTLFSTTPGGPKMRIGGEEGKYAKMLAGHKSQKTSGINVIEYLRAG